MRVLCQSASGRQVWIDVPPCRTDQQACARALAIIEREQPGMSWLAVGPCSAMCAWHTSPSRNRLAIRRWGLKPRDTTTHDRAHFHDQAPLNSCVEAVYVFTDRDQALAWARNYGPFEYGGTPMDVWEVHLRDHHPTEADAYSTLYHLSSAVRVLAPIEPEYVRLLTTV